MLSLRSAFLAVFVAVLTTGFASQTAILTLRGALSTSEQRFILNPTGAFAFERNEMADPGHALANAVDQIEVVRMRTQNPGAAMGHHIDEVLSREPIVHRDDDGTELRDRIELLEVLMRVGRDRGDSITLADAKPC